VNYSYDAASQLTGMNYELAGITLGNLAYTYDQDGRRNQMSGSWARTGLSNPTVSDAVYNAANELTNWNGATLTYDGNGNMTSDGTNTYTWDARNHLASIAGNYTASFEYDPFGRRLGKTVNGTTTDFLYDGANPIQELSGATVTANLLTGLGVDEYLTRTDATGTSDFLTDALGSTIGLADPTGTLQTEYTYDPFGGTTVQGASNANSYEFTGRENDGQGLYYYRARYYDPMRSRFISQDPIQYAGGINYYAYVGDDPVIFIDPLGLCWIYQQSTGRIWHNTADNTAMVRVGVGYAGHGVGLNNPAYQGVPNVGPLPQGTYTIGPQRTHVIDNGQVHIPGSMRLTQISGNTFDRGGFFIHGARTGHYNSNPTDSSGCIVVKSNIRNKIAKSKDNCLEVVP
jgi:RHS repeat-associated protein